MKVEDEIVARTLGDAHWDGVEFQGAASFPSDDVICTSSVAADAQAADQFAFRVVERETVAEYNHSTNGFTEQP